MQVIYAKEHVPHSIFLVGPTPRSKSVKSWRPEALAMLAELKYKGTVYSPEPRDGNWSSGYEDQIEWENQAIQSSTCVVAWVPRDIETMPAFTTNVEFGMLLRSGKFLYGRPDGSPKCAYLDYMYTKTTGKEPVSNLAVLLAKASTF